MSAEPEHPIVSPLATPADVAALLRARTKDDDGRELGEWTEDTRPTEQQVEEQIQIAEALMFTAVGVAELPESCMTGGGTVVALLAACLVESSYFPEQVTSNRSPYIQLRELYEAAQVALTECVSRNAESRSDAFEIVTPPTPTWWPPWGNPAEWWQHNLGPGETPFP